MITETINKLGKWPFFLYLFPVFFCVTWVYRRLLPYACVHITELKTLYYPAATEYSFQSIY